MNRPHLVWVTGLLLAAFGCSAEAPADNGNLPGESVENGGIAGNSSPGVRCPAQNLTQACSCASDGGQVPGRQVCDVSTGWKPCECEKLPETLSDDGIGVVDPALNKGPGRFDWEETVPGNGECVSGHYEGAFDGFYLSAATWGWGTIPVAGNVGFDLGEATNGEYYTVSNGYMKGVALGLFPFEGEVAGTLDCANAYFDGLMVKCQYIVGVMPYKFEGLLRAKYDKVNHAFVSGLWSVTEPGPDGGYPEPPDIQPGNPPPSPWPAFLCGGTGGWSATWKP